MCSSVVHVCILFSHLIICSQKRRYLGSEQTFSSSVFLIVHCEEPWIIYALYSKRIWKTIINFLLVSSLVFSAAVPKCSANVNVLTRVPLTGRRVNFILVARNYETRKEVKDIPAFTFRWRQCRFNSGPSSALPLVAAAQAPDVFKCDCCAYTASPTKIMFGRDGKLIQFFKVWESLPLLNIKTGCWVALVFYHLVEYIVPQDFYKTGWWPSTGRVRCDMFILVFT